MRTLPHYCNNNHYIYPTTIIAISSEQHQKYLPVNDHLHLVFLNSVIFTGTSLMDFYIIIGLRILLDLQLTGTHLICFSLSQINKKSDKTKSFILYESCVSEIELN